MENYSTNTNRPRKRGIKGMKTKYTLVPVGNPHGKLVKDKDKQLSMIKALKTFDTRTVVMKDGQLEVQSYTVHEGELGGLVQGYSNLSQSGSCWIFPDAEVYDNSVVSDDAIVVDSILNESAKVYSKAVVRGTRLRDKVQIGESAIILNDMDKFNIICGNAIINGSTFIHDCKQLFIGGNSLITGKVTITGSDVAIDDKVRLKGNSNGTGIQINTHVKLTESVLIQGIAELNNVIICDSVNLRSEEIIKGISAPGKPVIVSGRTKYSIVMHGATVVSACKIHGSGRIGSTSSDKLQINDDICLEHDELLTQEEINRHTIKPVEKVEQVVKNNAVPITDEVTEETQVEIGNTSKPNDDVTMNNPITKSKLKVTNTDTSENHEYSTMMLKDLNMFESIVAVCDRTSGTLEIQYELKIDKFNTHMLHYYNLDRISANIGNDLFLDTKSKYKNIGKADKDMSEYELAKTCELVHVFVTMGLKQNK